MKIDYAKLAALADAATPGPWKSDGCGDVWTIHSDFQKWSEDDSFFHGSIGTTRRGPDSGDAKYIAAASPDVVKELIRQVDVMTDTLTALERRCCVNIKAMIVGGDASMYWQSEMQIMRDQSCQALADVEEKK